MWQNTSFKLPSVIADAFEPVASLLDLASSETSLASSQLATLRNKVSSDLSASELAAQALGSAYDSFASHYGSFYTLLLHPFCAQANEFKNGYPYLSVPNAIEFIKTKFRNTDKTMVQTKFDVLMIVCSGGDYDQFSRQIGALKSIFGIDGLELVEQKSQEYANLERTKMQLPEHSVSPRWAETKASSLPFLGSIKDVGEQFFSKVDASDIFDELSDLISMADDYSSEIKSTFNALKVVASINAKSAFYENLTLPALADRLTAPNTHDSVLNTVICVAAPAGSGQILKMVAGL